jgi:ankyrin repeat protein
MTYRISRIVILQLMILITAGCMNSSNTATKSATPVQSEVTPVITAKDISIHEAALNGQLSLVSGLLSGGIDVDQPDQDGRTALMYASYNGHNEVIKKIIESKADINIQDNYGRTALMMAASGPYPAADPNLVDKEEQFTALMYAAAEGQTDVVKILLSYRADPSLKDVDGDDALTFARNNGHQAVVTLLGSLKK